MAPSSSSSKRTTLTTGHVTVVLRRHWTLDRDRTKERKALRRFTFFDRTTLRVRRQNSSDATTKLLMKYTQHLHQGCPTGGPPTGQSMSGERKTERSEPKIGWSGAEGGAGVSENDGAGAERGAEGRGGAGTEQGAG